MYTEQTIEKILEEYKKTIRHKADIFRNVLGCETEDLIQEAMIALARAVISYDASKGASFASYAGICIDHALINAYNAGRTAKNLALNSAASLDEKLPGQDELTLADSIPASSLADPGESLIQKELLENLLSPGENIFSSLERNVLSLLVRGCSTAEIAAKLGMTAKQTDNAVQRVRKKIKTYLI